MTNALTMTVSAPTAIIIIVIEQLILASTFL